MSKRDRIILLAFVAVNLLLKLSGMGRHELAHDEPFTVYWAFRPWSAFVDMLGTENNPPLFFLLMRAWAPLVPLEEAWLRLPSALFSALAVWPLFLLARRLGGLWAAIAAAGFFTFSTHHLAFAHEVRAYALFTLLTCTAFWQLLRSTDGARDARWWLPTLFVLLAYTHFFGWLVIGLNGLCVIFIRTLRHGTRTWALSTGMAVLAYLPYGWIFFRRASESIGQGTWLEAPVPEEIYNMVWRWSNAPVVAVALLLLIAVGLWRARLRDAGISMAAIWTFVPLLGLFAISFAVPVYLDRYLLFAAPGFALLAGLSLATLPTRFNAAGALAVLLGMMLTYRPDQHRSAQPSAVVAQAEAWRGEGPVLIQPPFYAPAYAWQIDRALLRDTADLHINLIQRGIHPVHGVADLPVGTMAWDQVVWVDAWAALTDPEAQVERALREHYPRVDSVEADHKVWVYSFSR